MDISRDPESLLWWMMQSWVWIVQDTIIPPSVGGATTTIVMGQAFIVTLRDTGAPEANAQIRIGGAERSMKKDLSKETQLDGKIRIKSNTSGLGFVFLIGRNT